MSQGQPPPAPTATCGSCGAPDDGEFVNCKYCKRAVSAEALAKAIPCPNPACKMACRWGKQKCAACQAWIIVSCVFCGSLSPHNCSNCLRCNEAFAGAPQRKAAMQQQQQQQQQQQNIGMWGGVAAAFAGAAVGGAVGGHYGHSSHHYYSSSDDYSPPSSNDFDTGGVIDDVGDFGDFGD